MRLTIGIKALNEERHIAAALESALAAAEAVGGEVVLADSGSTDATLAIAARYPAVRVVQIADRAQACCGAGAQLAFQVARGDFFYLLDGDMVLQPGFIEAGLAFLDANPGHAAVGGGVREVELSSIEFELRARNDRIITQPGTYDLDRLDCGGLYRTAAIRSVGWFADRNLRSFEEFELGARLAAAGWRLARIEVPAVEHHGHRTGGYRLLWRRIMTGYAGGPGEVLRASLGRSHWRQVARRFGQLRHGGAVIAWWLSLLGTLAAGWWPVTIALLILPVAFLTWRRGTLRLGLYSLATWNMIAIGLIQGLFHRRLPPGEPIPMIEPTSAPGTLA